MGLLLLFGPTLLYGIIVVVKSEIEEMRHGKSGYIY